MLAQLKTVVLIKEAIKLAFFRLAEYLEHQHLWVRYRLRMARNKELSSETRQSRSHTTLCTTPFTEQRKLALTRIERGVGGPGALLSMRTSTFVSSLRNRCLTSPQLAASLNSTRKTPVSTSTVKRRLWDALPG